MQGHWLLAKLGKRVLRPGGIGLTRRILAAAAPVAADRIVEFGPGVGRTAELLLARGPASYRAVDPNPEGREQVARILAAHPRAEYVVADAARTGLPDACADLVVGEAMLTIQSDRDKRVIVSEAVRILAPGGRYAIHELALRDDRTPEQIEEIRTAISRTIKVGARPLTLGSWIELLEDAGLIVEWTGSAPMHLLEPGRLVDDEGFIGACRFWYRMRRTPGAYDRVKAMRQGFRLQGRILSAVGIVARKPAETAVSRSPDAPASPSAPGQAGGSTDSGDPEQED